MTGLKYVEGYLVTRFRSWRKSMFLCHPNYKTGSLTCIHIYVASKWSLTPSSRAPTCHTPYKAAWLAKQPWKDFLFNLPFKETEQDTPHITTGRPYNMKIDTEWNSRGTNTQALVHPTRGPTDTLLISLKSTHDPGTYVVDNLEAKVPLGNTIQITNYSSILECTLRCSRATH